MTVETPVTYINDLNAGYPAEDEVGTLHEGNDHLRNIKKAIKQTFPNVAGAVLPTHTELNYVDGVTSSIQTQLNTLSSTIIPSGTKMLFQQSAAPTGWTKDTTHNDKALRVVSGTASSGGSVAFSTLFGRTATDAFTLTAAHIPNHTHSISLTTGVEPQDHTHTGYTNWAGDHQHSFAHGGDDHNSGLPNQGWTAVGFGTYATEWTAVGGAHQHTVQTYGRTGQHTHAVSGNTGGTGSGGSHSHAVDMRVQYVDLIICTRN